MKVDMSALGLDISARNVVVFDEGVVKRDVLDTLVDVIAETDAVTDRDAFRQAIHDRESVMSTGIGSGVAIPHVRIDQITKPTVGVGIARSGIDFQTLDDEPVYIVVMFAMPSGSQKEYLKLLSQVMISVKKTDFREHLLSGTTPQEIADILNGG